MVRLRSNRWYSGDGQRRIRRQVSTQNLGYRRLVSLCLLLGLVLILMQRAADPKYIAQAFRVLGVPLESEQADGATEAASVRRSTSGSVTQTELMGAGDEDVQRVDALMLAWQATCKDLVPRLLSSASGEQINGLAKRWQERVLHVDRDASVDLSTSSSQSAELGQPLEALFASNRAQLDELQAKSNLEDQAQESDTEGEAGGSEEDKRRSSDPDADDLDWKSLIARFVAEWQAIDDLLTADDLTEQASQQFKSQVSSELRSAVVNWLDESMLASMRDGAPWRSKEKAAFAWWLNRTATATRIAGHVEDRSSAPPVLNTLQLEAEHERYRGQVIRFRGSIRRAERQAAAQSASSHEGYWLMWLRGEDNASQPVAIYAAQSVLDRNRFQPVEQMDIEIYGVVGKRLAYASASGLQIAPTLFAVRLLRRVTSEGPNGVSASSSAAQLDSQAKSNLRSQFGLAILLGAVVAGCILLPILWQWRRADPLTARPTTPRRRISSGRTSSGSREGRIDHLLTLVLFLGVHLYFGLTMLLAQQIEPPWAEKVNDDQQRIAIFKEKIEASLNTEELESIRDFLDGELAEIPTQLLKVIHALKQLDWRLVKSESMQAESSALLETESWALEFPDLDLRVEPVRCFGIVRYAMPVALSLEQQLWFQETDADMVFRLMLADVQVADGRPSVAGEVLPVLTTHCPRQWTEAARLRQPTALDGLCLREMSSQKCLCVLTERPQWRFDLVFPAAVDTSSESLSPDVGNPLRALSQSGFDLSFVDVVRRNSQRPLQPDETKPLMSLLRIIAQSSFSIDQLRADTWEPLQAMGDAKQAFAQPVDWNVRLVSGSVVPVDDAVAQQILGSQRYFQFDGFVDIGDRRIRYQVDGKELSFEREFPVTILSREFTPFVPREELQGGELSWPIGKFARIRGCFYRLWSYDSEYLQRQATGGRQAAPLILAAEMRLGRPQISASETSEIGWFGYALCVATLGILAIILWQAFRHDSPRIFPRSR